MRDHSQQDEEAEINMTPMLDIVFIMLIFFIVTAVFVKEAGTQVNKPSAETSGPQTKASILIAITEDNEIWLNQDEVELASVRPMIEKLHAENPKGTVVIQADVKSNAAVMMDVYDAIRDAGIDTIAVATED